METKMNDNNLINKDFIRGFLEHLSPERTLVGPVDTGKVIEYRETKADEILLDDNLSYNSIKSYFFPQTELMFTFENDDITDNTNIPGYVIFGARPCDLEALRVMNAVYTTGKYIDPFFQRRLDANFIIGIGCKNIKPGCFCTEMNINKEFSDYCDIMLFPENDSYIITHISEKGTLALKSYYDAIEINRELDFNDFLLINTNKSIIKNKPELENKLMLDINKHDSDYFDVIDWEKVTETCQGCGICTYICPTCYCFDFKDVTKHGKAERYKCWDSCMYPKFTLHASGHNPRNKRYERYRQRVLHKYKYVPENFAGHTACTGCGRCIRNCPVGINIKNILKQLIGNTK